MEQKQNQRRLVNLCHMSLLCVLFKCSGSGDDQPAGKEKKKNGESAASTHQN